MKHNIGIGLIAAIYVLAFAVIFSAAFAWGDSGLTRAVVIRALAQRGFVAGQTVEFDRVYVLQSVSTTAVGDGEFIVRFKARPQ